MGDRFCKIYYLREDDLIATIRDSGAQYFVVTPRFRYFEAYLRQNPNFVKERDFGTDRVNPSQQKPRDMVSVYSIRQAASVPAELEPAVNYALARSIEFFAQQKPERFAFWREHVLFGTFGLSERQLSDILERESRCFTKRIDDPAFRSCLPSVEPSTVSRAGDN
jgi:hypothetical protein